LDLGRPSDGPDLVEPFCTRDLRPCCRPVPECSSPPVGEDDLRRSEQHAVVTERPVVTIRPAGLIMPADMDFARQAVDLAVAEIGRDVDQPVLRLTVHSGSARPPLAVVQVNAMLGQRLVRSQTAASTVRDAVEQTVDGLRRRLRRLDRRLRAEAAGQVFSSGVRRVSFPAAPIGLVSPRSRSATLVRVKSCPAVIQHIEAAAFIMELRDYPFHLFLEDSTLAPAVLRHGGPSGYQLIRSVASAPSPPATVAAHLAQAMGVAQAIKVLNADSALRFLFFLDPATGRGRVLYRRYDGHLGLLAAN
jgi:hypothetical protein